MKTNARTPRKTRRRGGSNQRRGGSNQRRGGSNQPAPVPANAPVSPVLANAPVPANVPANAPKSSGLFSWLGFGGSRRKRSGKRKTRK